MGDARQQPKSLVRQAAAYAPSAGIFGPTTGLDHRLFNERFRLRPEVAEAIMHRLDTCIRTDSGLAGSDWQDWTRVYLTGGSASEWAGDRPNDSAQDLDVIVAIDLKQAQGYNAFEGMDAGEAASALNRAFWARFNADHWHAPFGGVWNLTAFCNQRAWDITQIKPYAAWSLTDHHWAVKPPSLPEHTIADFSPAVLAHARAVAAQARAILRMDEPLRTREATALWQHVHEHRCQAFSPAGSGWDDPGNVDEKYLAYHPHHLLQKIKDLALAKTASREDQLAAMDSLTRAAALAQETVRQHHPLVTRPVHVKDGQSSVVLSTWLTQRGHPLAATAYVTGQPGTDYSCTGRGPDGEPAVMLHRDRRDHGTMAHEAAHLLDDHESGREPGASHGPDGAHNANWARHYASMLNALSSGAGDTFLAERDQELSAMRHEAAEGTERRTNSDALPSGAGMVYLSVPHGKVQGGGEHHVTLAYLPRNMSDEHFDRVSEIARDAASRHDRFRGVLEGGGTFPEGADRTKKRTAFLPLDAPAAHPLQKEFDEVNRSHYPVYSPHITRAYLKPGDEDPEPHPRTWVNFTHVHVRRGDEVRSFPLRVPEEAPPPETRAQMWQRLDTERRKADMAEDARQREIENRTMKPWARHEGVSGYDGLGDRTAMIYLELPPGTVRPVPGGVDDHHITVVYLGKNVSDEKWAEACRRTQAAAAQCPQMEGVLRGIDIFPPSASSDGKVPAFVPAYVGGIGRLRRLLEDLSASEHKDYRPHVTLAYLTEGDSLPEPHPAVPLRFTHVHCMRGDEVVSYPLGGDIAATAAYRQPPTEETWEARRQRVNRYLDQQHGETMSLPSKWGPHVPNYIAHGLIQEHDGPTRDEHWEHLPDEYVSLRQPIHTHQGYVYPETVRHYLNLDADPETPDYHEYTPGGDDPKIVRHEGAHYLLDGHHRYAKDRLMGHESMSAKVFDTSDPEHKQSNCYECHADEANRDYDHDSDTCDTCRSHGWYV